MKTACQMETILQVDVTSELSEIKFIVSQKKSTIGHYLAALSYVLLRLEDENLTF